MIEALQNKNTSWLKFRTALSRQRQIHQKTKISRSYTRQQNRGGEFPKEH